MSERGEVSLYLVIVIINKVSVCTGLLKIWPASALAQEDEKRVTEHGGFT